MKKEEIYKHVNDADKANADCYVHAMGPAYSEIGYSYDEVEKVFIYAYNLALERAEDIVDFDKYKNYIKALKITE